MTAPVDRHVALVAGGYMAEGVDGEIVECGLMDSVAKPSSVFDVVWAKPTMGAYRPG